MAFNLRTWATYEGKLGDAGRILVKHGTEGLQKVGQDIRESVRQRAREFTGEEKRRIRVIVSGRGLNKLVEVYGELIQHVIDEHGLPPGTFQPWGVGSRIYKWAEKKGLHTRPRDTGLPRRPTRKISHVNTRRPASVRAKLRWANVGSRKPAEAGVTPVGYIKPRAPRLKGQRTQKSLAKERAIRQLAFLVARSIFERGIRANKPFSRTLEANRVAIVRDLAAAFQDAVAEINRG